MSTQKTGGGGRRRPVGVNKAATGSNPGPIKATQAFSLTTGTLDVGGWGVGGGGQVHPRTKRSSSDRQQSGGGSPNRDRRTLGDGVGMIRKSRSVDFVTFSCYLNGEWPRADPLVAQAYFCPSNLTSDKTTQTPQEWCHIRSSKSLKSELSNLPSSITSEDSLKTIRACLTRSSRESRRHTLGGCVPNNSTLSVNHRFSPLGLALPSKPAALPELQRNQACVFGNPDSLSQEIEKFSVAASISYSVKSSPDGRCAPVAEQLKMCSVVTQTPAQFVQSKEIYGSAESLRLVPEAELSYREDSDFKGSNSPELVRFASSQSLADRLAPEGCEKISGKFQEVKKVGGLPVEVSSPSMKVPSFVCHIPSDSSAFNPPPLVKNYTSLSTLTMKKINSV